LNTLRCSEEAPKYRRSGRGNRICILGGGFGGVNTALKLAALAPLEDPKAEITLVDSSERFVFLPLLYELVTGELQDWEVAPVFTDVLQGSGVRFVHGSVSSLDRRNRTVTVHKASVAGGGEERVEFDKLVVALGQEPSLPAAGGIADHAIPFYRVEHAKQLRARLQRLREGSTSGRTRVAVVGGGYSGVELSCSLAELCAGWGDVTLFQRSDNVLRGGSRYGRTTSRQEMQRRGVRLEADAEIRQVGADSISFSCAGGEERTECADVVVWTGGSTGNSAVQGMGFVTNEYGQLDVDLNLRVRGEEGVFALGDAAASFDVLGEAAPRSASAAVQQSETLAWNLHASLTGGLPVKFRYQNLGEMMAFGPGAASVNSDVFGLKASGPLAAAIRRATYLIRMPGAQHRQKVAASWAARLPGDIGRVLGQRDK